ncbi:hypothetical protein GC098_25275, partial [Paenibacillus sp. LMG 31458]|nr:hypothetical protein [Paenibacillus phytorum]
MTVIFLNAPRFISTALVRCNHLDEHHFFANSYTSIFLLQEGRGEVYDGEQLLSISERDLLVIHPSSEYRIRATSEICIRGVLISIDGLHFSGLSQGLLFEPHLQPILRIGEDFNKINRFFSDIHKEATATEVGFLDLIASLLQTLFILLFRLTEHHLRSSTNSISQIAKAYIEENYQKDLSLVDLAEIVYVS